MPVLGSVKLDMVKVGLCEGCIGKGIAYIDDAFVEAGAERVNDRVGAEDSEDTPSATRCKTDLMDSAVACCRDCLFSARAARSDSTTRRACLCGLNQQCGC